MRKWYSLIDKVYRIENLIQAFKAVKANKGAPGTDGETVEAFDAKQEENIARLHEELKTGKYQAQPVKRVYIEKDDGTKRPLGIPTIRDRVVQQALKNVLEPIFEPKFHPSSYGYRPGKSCQKAVAKAERFMNKYGLQYVIDMDLSKCFDTLDHEIILKAVNKEISDGKVLKLILNFLKSGVMEGWIQTETEIGCPQGGPISPLLMNIYLNEFDQRMKSKGIRIVRYADDILVFARNKSEAGRNMAEATQILEQELKLKINKEKTHITEVEKGVAFLGFVIFTQCIKIHPKRVVKFKKRIKELTKRNRGTNLEQTIEEINPIIRGWANYFRIANCEGTFRNLMGWVRRRLRMKKMLEWKTWKPLHKQLRKLGYKGEFKKIYVKRWRNSASPLAQMALPNSWFDEMKLVNMARIKTGILSCYYE